MKSVWFRHPVKCCMCVVIIAAAIPILSRGVLAQEQADFEGVPRRVLYR